MKRTFHQEAPSFDVGKHDAIILLYRINEIEREYAILGVFCPFGYKNISFLFAGATTCVFANIKKQIATGCVCVLMKMGFVKAKTEVKLRYNKNQANRKIIYNNYDKMKH